MLSAIKTTMGLRHRITEGGGVALGGVTKHSDSVTLRPLGCEGVTTGQVHSGWRQQIA